VCDLETSRIRRLKPAKWVIKASKRRRRRIYVVTAVV
jgi:hypothetical protein